MLNTLLDPPPLLPLTLLLSPSSFLEMIDEACLADAGQAKGHTRKELGAGQTERPPLHEAIIDTLKGPEASVPRQLRTIPNLIAECPIKQH